VARVEQALTMTAQSTAKYSAPEGVPIRGAEDFSARIGAALKEQSGQQAQAARADRLRRARHLCEAILQRAQERRHTAGELASTLDMSLGHWYRIRKDPLRLGRLTLPRMDAMARYIGWPRVQVLVAVGWIEPGEVDEIVTKAGAIEAALQRLQHSGISNGLVTPIHRATPDHQVLMARLLIAAERAMTAVPKSA
jgi:hypothetical protein